MKKERDTRVLKIIAVFLLMIIVFPTFGNIFGAINEYYIGETTTLNSGLNIDGLESNNVITRAIFWFINTLGSLGEYLLTSFASVLASASTDNAKALMPWADAIIYNGVPALDINFINPAEGSLSSIMSNMMSKIYYTIFSISITFFSIAVLIMAIKLATTAIAAEKARYKESITNFIISLILIFSMHYFMSFCFYLNESIVKVAFSIASAQLQGEFVSNNANATEMQKNLINKFEIGANGRDSIYMSSAGNNWKEYMTNKLFDNGQYEKAAAYLAAGYGSFLNETEGEHLRTSSANDRAVILVCLADLVVFNKKFDSNTINGSYDKNDLEGTNELYKALKSSFYNQFVLEDTSLNWKGLNANYESEFKELYKRCFDLMTMGDNAGKYSEKENRLMKAVNDAINNIGNSSVNVSTNKMEDLGKSAVSQLSVYFKINRYTADGDISLVGVIIYTIFVFQSIMYFLAYLKRFIYIIILSFFAPFLVLFDFLSKTAGKQSGTLSKWIKEFCALVFIQSLQAFLLTMVSSLIFSINSAITDNGTSALGEATAQGLSIINIIALASMAKLEDLISDMVGLKSSIADTSLKGGAKMGLHGLAGGLMTMGALKRLGDNGKKIFGGARNIASTSKGVKAAMEAKNRKMDQFKELEGAQAAASDGGGDGSGSGTGNNGAATQKLLSVKDKHKYQDAMALCDEKIAEARRKRKEAVKGLASGIAETGGAVVGAGAGALAAGTIHAAAGDFDLKDVMSDAIKGAGVGDMVGAGAVNITTGIAGFAKDVKDNGLPVYTKRMIQKDIDRKKSEIEQMYKDAGIDVSNL